MRTTLSALTLIRPIMRVRHGAPIGLTPGSPVRRGSVSVAVVRACWCQASVSGTSGPFDISLRSDSSHRDKRRIVIAQLTTPAITSTFRVFRSCTSLFRASPVTMAPKVQYRAIVQNGNAMKKYHRRMIPPPIDALAVRLQARHHFPSSHPGAARPPPEASPWRWHSYGAHPIAPGPPGGAERSRVLDQWWRRL